MMDYTEFESYGFWLNYCMTNKITLNSKQRIEALGYFIKKRKEYTNRRVK